MRLHRTLSLLAAFAVLFSGMQAAVHAQTAPVPLTQDQIAKMPVVALQIKDFKLLSSGTGWTSNGNQLLFTLDNGAHWKDISPHNPSQGGIDQVVFLDANTGWVLYSVMTWEEDADFVVASTVDGGTNWTETRIKIPLADPSSGGPELGGNANFAFADQLHGWFLFDYRTGSAFSSAGLLATSDGGRTWHESNENPGFYGEISAYSSGDVWAVDGDGQNLVVSRKGGNSFEDVSLPNPKEFGTERQPIYSQPAFEDNRHGYLAGTYPGINGAKSTAVLFETWDGGRTWKSDRILSNLTGREIVSTTVAGTSWILPFTPQGAEPQIIKLNSSDKIKAPDHKSSGDFRSCNLSFKTPDEGWMNCSGHLTSTTDGGATWIAITPRVRNGKLTSDLVAPVKAKTIQTKTIHRRVAPAGGPGIDSTFSDH